MCIPYYVFREVFFKGYKIPENTEVIPLLYAINNDPSLWESPEKFWPSRFLDLEGRVSRPDYFIPFGIGELTTLYYFSIKYFKVKEKLPQLEFSGFM